MSLRPLPAPWSLDTDQGMLQAPLHAMGIEPLAMTVADVAVQEALDRSE